MKRVSLTINGLVVSGRAGQTLLQVARLHGIAIPTLCHFPGLAPIGGCRVCIVEVAGTPRPLPACATPAEEGMVVCTDTERIRDARRMIVELLLAERNHTCPVCVMDGSCEPHRRPGRSRARSRHCRRPSARWSRCPRRRTGRCAAGASRS